MSWAIDPLLSLFNLQIFFSETVHIFADRLAALSGRAEGNLREQGFRNVHCEPFLHMRFAKTDCAIMVTADYDPMVIFVDYDVHFSAVHKF